MTREEEIKCASKDYVNYLLDKQEYHNEDYTEYDIWQAFEKGAMFADNNPDLLSLWHDAIEEPKENSKIVIVDTKGEWWNIDYASDDFDGYGLYGWDFCIAHYNLKIWAYSNDLLPKVDKK